MISRSDEQGVSVTILMPCLNEEATLEVCITKAFRWAAKAGLLAEVLVADNGSTDKSVDIAHRLGARVVNVTERGYGAALAGGVLAAQGRWIVMGDADDSYDFSQLDAFIKKLDEGYDLVMGNRFKGGIASGAMPWKNRYIGNPVLSFIGRALFGSPVGDFHCGLRAFTVTAFRKMDLRTSGMEFASEMVIKATLLGLSITEVPTTLSRDGRSRPPHLRPWRDGWRHLRFMLLFSPNPIFVWPGLGLFIACVAMFSATLVRPIKFGDIEFSSNSLFAFGATAIIGLIMFCTGLIVKMFAVREGLLPPRSASNYMLRGINVEITGAIGIILMLAGAAVGWDAILEWRALNFGITEFSVVSRLVALSSLLALGGGVLLSFAFVCGFLSLPTRKS
jgi:glycosyltransferase involved in cell wall biosynthesis